MPPWILKNWPFLVFGIRVTSLHEPFPCGRACRHSPLSTIPLSPQRLLLRLPPADRSRRLLGAGLPGLPPFRPRPGLADPARATGALRGRAPAGPSTPHTTPTRAAGRLRPDPRSRLRPALRQILERRCERTGLHLQWFGFVSLVLASRFQQPTAEALRMVGQTNAQEDAGPGKGRDGIPLREFLSMGLLRAVPDAGKQSRRTVG
jgi:hypothetical protein